MEVSIGANEMVWRTTYGETSDGEPACVYCGAQLHSASLAEVPQYDDEESWEQLAHYHDDDCEWIRTRSHRIE